ncbi:MAG: HIT domain-containing protein [SAR202 cluster bacterium]|jgi:histidine triad (HIT) family protein|nr:HIT domain-containing protein [SAR202 cluster bacterium]HAL47901.1 histidine triad nucleotide-binding protein [Dehalococcoidia bacterium]MDP6664652.1 HIT domain-containing protein [SAR202 cluster bacterium]MDP6798487.1 HIT domain-containing protein [SAR202 cluster bacterium]MQG59239.1 HIT domain-containing protein [SAR202 cluster bacterium]|tara:strand:- start:9780 stop:10139 length:360 start_codon:yes stop_codon:yes gene_type:complete
MASDNCTFCKIIARRLPSRIEYEDNDIIVFHNQLGWVPVMLLLAPKEHITQIEMWQNGDLIARIGKLAVELGDKHCPDGYRLVSNVGKDAEQSQPHSHVHLIGGTKLGMYLGGPMRGHR